MNKKLMKILHNLLKEKKNHVLYSPILNFIFPSYNV